MKGIVFISEEADGVGDKDSRDATTVDTDILGGLFEHVPVICVFHL
jgi:hypothetical protein